MTRRGGCHCGAVRYEVEGELGPLVNCHCQFCRHYHGAAFATVALVMSDALRVSSGEDRIRELANAEGSRHFCGECGGRLYNRPESTDAFLMLVVGGLDEDPAAGPVMHVNTESKAAWYEILDSLPQHPGMPPAGGGSADG
jgi:hypothetical protein